MFALLLVLMNQKC